MSRCVYERLCQGARLRDAELTVSWESFIKKRTSFIVQRSGTV